MHGTAVCGVQYFVVHGTAVCGVQYFVRTLFECCLEIFLLRQKKHLKRKLFINLLIFKKDRKNAKLVDSS